jgi:hypothetical protein
MYRIPDDFDISPVVGESTTQLRVGQFDLQFTLGPLTFAVQSPIKLSRDGIIVGCWEEGRWPDPAFYEVMNSDVARAEIVNDRLMAIEFENGLTMHLEDSFDQYESMQINRHGSRSGWII